MKQLFGIIGVLLLLVLAFLGLNYIWNWVAIDLAFLGKSGLTLLIVAVLLLLLFIIWYVFLRPSSYQAPTGSCRVGAKKE